MRADQEVINFLVNCGNKNLQYLLVPNRLQAALAAMDTDHDGHIDLCEWETCIEIALQNKLEQRAAAREAQAKAAQKEIAEFTGEFLSAARQCFQLIDKDCGGSLSKTEIVEAVRSDQEVIRFLTTCGEDNLQFLLHPPRLQKALEILDTDDSGEVDEKEWCVWRRPFYHRLYAVIPSNLGRHRRDGSRPKIRADRRDMEPPRRHRRDGSRPKLTGRCAQGRSHPARPLEALGAAGARARAKGKGCPPRGRRIQHGVPERGS